MDHLDVLDECRKKGIVIGLDKEKLKILDPNKNLDKDLIENIKSNKDSLVQLFLRKNTLTPSDFPNAKITFQELDELQKKYANIHRLYMATPLQCGMLFHGMWDDNGDSYTQQSFMDFIGCVNVECVREAWKFIVNRHDILKTCFVGVSTQHVHQLVKEYVELPFHYEDWSGVDKQEIRLADFRREDKNRGVDFQSAPLLRVSLIRLSEEKYHFIWTYHHILLDAWCMPILIKEVLHVYERLANKKEINLPDVTPYENYISWLVAQDKKKSLEFWGSHLAGFKSPTKFIHDSILNEENSCHVSGFNLSSACTQALSSLAKKYCVTLNVIFQFAWAYMLKVYSNENDVVFGVVVSGRPAELKGVETMMGLFINTIPVRVAIDDCLTIKEMLERIHAENIKRDENSIVSLSEIQEVTDIESGVRIFDSILIFENTPATSSSAKKESVDLGFTIKSSGVDQQVDYPLLVRAAMNGGSLNCEFHAQTDSISSSISDLMARQFEELLINLSKSQALDDVKSLKLISKNDLSMLEMWSGEAVECKYKACIHELFFAQATKKPDKVALVYNFESLTFGELDQYAENLAKKIRYLCKQDNPIVALCIDRSIDMVVSMLAVLKCGGAYLPIDPSFPVSRSQQILKDSGAELVLTTSLYQENYPENGIKTVVLDGYDYELTSDAKKVKLKKCASNSLAYVIYTSGSTGVPKGVPVKHSQLMVFMDSINKVVEYQDDGSWLAVSNYSFDISILEILCSLANGLKVVIAPSQNSVVDDNSLTLAELLENERITHFQSTPTLLSIFIEDEKFLKGLLKVKKLLIGGEPISARLHRIITKKLGDIEVYNMYGPTEATIWATCGRINQDTQNNVIGVPLDYYKVQVVDSSLSMQPIGVPGELVISGGGVSEGYLNRSDLNAITFKKSGSDNIYITGDKARWLPSGEIEFLGRKDNQVKVRGYRIELGDIESKLGKISDVKDCIVIAHKGIGDETVLVAYIARYELSVNSDKDFSAEQDYKRLLRENLPEYMIPSKFIFIDDLALTPSGKIDRKALPKPDNLSNLARVEYVQPRNEIEEEMCRIWQEVLSVERIGVMDNFFELGGHSLSAMRLASSVSSYFDKPIKIKDIYTNPTTEGLSKIVLISDESKNIGLTDIEHKDLYETSYKQKTDWVANRHAQIVGVASICVQMASAFNELDVGTLIKTIDFLVARHEILRTSLHAVDGSLYQKIHDTFSVAEHVNVIDRSEEGIEPEYIQYVRNSDMNSTFDFSFLPLFKVTLIKSKRTEFLVMTFNHVCVDQQFMTLLADEFKGVYKSLNEGGVPELPYISHQYKEFASWERGQIYGENGRAHLEYWRDLIGDVSGCNQICQIADFSSAFYKNYDDAIFHQIEAFPKEPDEDFKKMVYGCITNIYTGDDAVSSTYSFQIQEETFNKLEELSKDLEVPVSSIMISAVSLLFKRLTNKTKILLAILAEVRSEVGASTFGGCLINEIMVVSDFSNEHTVESYLKSTANQILESDSHKIYPLAKLMKDLNLSVDSLGGVFMNYGSHSSHENLIAELPVHREGGFPVFDMNFSMSTYLNGIQVNCEYRCSKFKPCTIEKISNQLVSVINHIIEFYPKKSIVLN